MRTRHAGGRSRSSAQHSCTRTTALSPTSNASHCARVPENFALRNPNRCSTNGPPKASSQLHDPTRLQPHGNCRCTPSTHKISCKAKSIGVHFSFSRNYASTKCSHHRTGRTSNAPWDSPRHTDPSKHAPGATRVSRLHRCTCLQNARQHRRLQPNTQLHSRASWPIGVVDHGMPSMTSPHACTTSSKRTPRSPLGKSRLPLEHRKPSNHRDSCRSKTSFVKGWCSSMPSNQAEYYVTEIVRRHTCDWPSEGRQARNATKLHKKTVSRSSTSSPPVADEAHAKSSRIEQPASGQRLTRLNALRRRSHRNCGSCATERRRLLRWRPNSGGHLDHS